ncbi:MAG: hypothetical protein WAW85_12765 [Gordonia sp. (in: high G+C Gram-positive bacteria)]|uniref:hypothetical protein n=1 Tax=Gordonia sp. (in: high G+C Gram-positive bacteria) TaxID=84139 RepID=UPI003BB6BA8F
MIAAIVIVGLVVGLLIWQPWSSNDDAGGTATAAAPEEFLLDQDITVIVEVPGGWRAEATSFDGDRIVMLLPDSETRSADTVLADADHPETAGGTHAVLARVDECDASSSAGYQAVDTWRLGKLKTDEDGSVQNAAMRVNGLYCLDLVGVDLPAGSTPAGDLVRASAVDGNTTFTARVTID